MSNILDNPKMLARIVRVQIEHKKPTPVQLGAVHTYLSSQVPGVIDMDALAAVDHIAATSDAAVPILSKVKDAIKAGDYESLANAAGSGAVEVQATTTGRVNPLAIPAAPAAPAVEPATPPEPVDIPATPSDSDETPEALMAKALALIQGKRKEGAVNEAAVREIVASEMAKHADTVTSNVSEMVAAALKRIEEAGAKAGVRRIEVVEGGKVNPVEGATHWQFEQVLTWLSAGVPVWLWGAAGAGKTHLGRQLAEALGVSPYIVSIDPTITVGKLVGYRNLATGEYVPGLLTEAYRDGGLLMLDEIDTGDPGIIACLNSLLANGHYLFPCGTTITRHPKFRAIAGANTKGTGAVAGYTARQRLDAATLNRFAVLELEYDERLEDILAIGSSDKPARTWNKSTATDDAVAKRWVKWVQKVRDQVGTSVLISPRASYLGVAALRAGVPISEVANALVFPLVSNDTRTNITSACGLP